MNSNEMNVDDADKDFFKSLLKTGNFKIIPLNSVETISETCFDELDNKYKWRVELPGFHLDEVSVDANNLDLTVTAVRVFTIDDLVWHTELPSVKLSVRMMDDACTTGATAVLKNGVLIVTLEKLPGCLHSSGMEKIRVVAG